MIFKFKQAHLHGLMIVLGFSLALGSCKKSDDVVPAHTPIPEAKIPDAKCEQTIKDKYVVLLKPDQSVSAQQSSDFYERKKQFQERTNRFLSRIGLHKNSEKTFHTGVQGFVATLSTEDVKVIKSQPEVALVEPDKIVTLQNNEVGVKDVANKQEIQWGVKRVGYAAPSAGKYVWIIDTGVDVLHPDLNVSTSKSHSFIDCKGIDDDNGHGTHVAGIIGAKDNDIGVVGVAPGTEIAALKALDAKGSGNISTIIEAIDWIAVNGKAGDVVNMSVGGGISEALDQAVYNTSMKGIYFAVAAGNEGKSVANCSPGRVNSPFVFTVSAMDEQDTWADFSNFGNSVDFCAPGVSILSTYPGNTYAYMSGTSMATPHLAGLLIIKGRHITTEGTVKNDPDGKADPIAHM